ncbi:hypothetical protein AU255_04955 [Methyloprofundus sedimenti]|uniref:Uncharacterized protein n=1 Tax=Methyloprofundus sedimenti TaxID=1420851 RepID=A0A1V8M788_9GAMM|nr:hypothetical protein [Methyloprofundus sedimenti]OQK17243.1 hypothetical protein AU255_04955 [Methyloprofundus sedimenti]
MTTQTQVTLNDLTPSKKIPEKYPELFPEKKWKWKVAQRQHNGLARAFRKIGRDLYVNELVLAECINEQLTA